MALPLFRLPILVIKLIFETMGFIEIFVLTSTSSKTKRIFKNLVTIRNYEMTLFLGMEDYTFDFRTESDPTFGAPIYLESEENQLEDVFSLKIGSCDNVPSAFSRAVGDHTIILTIYWSTNINNATELYNALSEVFKMPLKGINMDLKGISSEKCISWINWKNEYFPDIQCLDIVGTCSFQNYVWILKNVKTQKKLLLEVEPTEYPENPEIVEFLNVKMKTLMIRHGKWINIQQLKAFKGQKITIWNVSLTDFQVNTFLRDWNNSGVESNWKQLKIHFNREANSNIVLEGLDVTDEDFMRPDDVISQWSFNTKNGEKCTVVYTEYESDVMDFGFEFHLGN